MCRLLARIGAPASPEPAVWSAPHSLLRQSYAPREMLSGTVNADGYGVAWRTDGGFIRIAESRPIWNATDLSPVLTSIRTPVFLAAVRNVTPGIVADPTGLQPMLRDGHAFLFNGFITDFRRRAMRRMLDELPDDLLATLTGTSDTESLFLHAIRFRREGAGLREALTGACLYAVTVARQVGTEAILTCVMAGEGGIAAVRTGTGARQNTLYMRRGEDGTMLASEPVEAPEAWEEIGRDRWVEVAPDGAIETGPVR